MRRRTLIGSLVAVVGLTSLALLDGRIAARHQPEAGADTPTRVVVQPDARAMVLAEMRHMLESPSGIAQGLAGNDLPAVEKAARGLGMAVA